MLRKSLNIIPALLMFITTSGFTVYEHFCGSDLVSVAIDTKAGTCCNNDRGNCCHDESVHFQLKEDFVFSTDQFSLEKYFPIDLHLIPYIISGIHLSDDNANGFTTFNDSSPPPKIQTALAKLQTYLF